MAPTGVPRTDTRPVAHTCMGRLAEAGQLLAATTGSGRTQLASEAGVAAGSGEAHTSRICTGTHARGVGVLSGSQNSLHATLALRRAPSRQFAGSVAHSNVSIGVPDPAVQVRYPAPQR